MIISLEQQEQRFKIFKTDFITFILRNLHFIVAAVIEVSAVVRWFV